MIITRNGNTSPEFKPQTLSINNTPVNFIVTEKPYQRGEKKKLGLKYYASEDITPDNLQDFINYVGIDEVCQALTVRENLTGQQVQEYCTFKGVLDLEKLKATHTERSVQSETKPKLIAKSNECIMKGMELMGKITNPDGSFNTDILAEVAKLRADAKKFLEMAEALSRKSKEDAAEEEEEAAEAQETLAPAV